MSPNPGTLYRALDRLTRQGLLETSDVPTPGGAARRLFQLSPLGSRVAAAEAERRDFWAVVRVERRPRSARRAVGGLLPLAPPSLLTALSPCLRLRSGRCLHPTVVNGAIRVRLPRALPLALSRRTRRGVERSGRAADVGRAERHAASLQDRDLTGRRRHVSSADEPPLCGTSPATPARARADAGAYPGPGHRGDDCALQRARRSAPSPSSLRGARATRVDSNGELRGRDRARSHHPISPICGRGSPL